VGETKVAELLTTQDMVDGRLDVQTLKEAVNEDKMITPRIGQEYASVPMASRLLVENGLLGATPFGTYTAMTASALANGDYAVVTNDADLGKNGVYQKLSGIFVYSKYNLQPQITAIETQLTSEKNSPLRNLYNDLNNPLMSVKIKLVGDSITWGVGASGTNISTPRTGKLTDPRNTTDPAISPTWANLLREYLAKAYTDGLLVRNSVGVAYAESKNNICFSRDARFFEFKNTATKEIFSEDYARSLIKNVAVDGGEWLQLFSYEYPTQVKIYNQINFEINGAGFDLFYTKLKNGTADSYFINVYVDDVFHQKISIYDAVGGYNYTTRVNLPNNGKHRITIRNESTFASIVNLQYMTVIKRVTVANDGISGSTTNSWLDAVKLSESIQANDDYVFVMLGTNDRIKASYHGESVFAKNMRTIVDNIKTLTANKARVVLMSASAVTQGEDPVTSNYFMTMRVVNNTIKNIADEKKVSFISNYAATQQYKIDSDAFLADGLHPNDFGHRAIFENIKNAIVNS